MPAWLIPLLIKYGVPVVISILQKTGAINWAEKVALKAGYDVVEGVEGIKTFSAPSDYPDELKGQRENAPSTTNISNVNK